MLKNIFYLIIQIMKIRKRNKKGKINKKNLILIK